MRVFNLDKESDTAAVPGGAMEVLIDDRLTDKPRQAVISFPSGSPLNWNPLNGTTSTDGRFVGETVLYFGFAADVPAGWAICDGRTQNGTDTPDMRGRVPAGADPNFEGDSTHVNDLLPVYPAGYVGGFDWVGGAGASNNTLYLNNTDTDEAELYTTIYQGSGEAVEVSLRTHVHRLGGTPLVVEGIKYSDPESFFGSADNRAPFRAWYFIMWVGT